MVGTVRGYEVAENRDSVGKKLMLQVEISDEDDIQDVQLMLDPGVDTVPLIGSTVAIVEAGESYKIAVAVDDDIEPESSEGEYEIYSASGGAKVAKLLIDTEGTFTFSNGADNAVRFSELESAFNTLKSELENFISVYLVHTHPTAPVGPISPPTPAAPPLSPVSQADVEGAKIDEIKVP